MATITRETLKSKRAAERRAVEVQRISAGADKVNLINTLISSLGKAVESLAPLAHDDPEGFKQLLKWTVSDLRWWSRLAAMREFKEELDKMPRREHEDKLLGEALKQLTDKENTVGIL